MSTDSQRHRVTVTLPRPAGNDILVPPGSQAIAGRAAAVGPAGLMTAWTSAQALVSMTVEVPRRADALSAGWAIARALGGGHGTSVEAEPVRAR